MSKLVKSYKDLDVYQMAMAGAMIIFERTKSFPLEEKYSLTDQIRRSSRSVCANIAEAWRKRRYKMAFISKLSDAETEADETLVWLEFALHCTYIDKSTFSYIADKYDKIIGKLVMMISAPDRWLLEAVENKERKKKISR